LITTCHPGLTRDIDSEVSFCPFKWNLNSTLMRVINKHWIHSQVGHVPRSMQADVIGQIRKRCGLDPSLPSYEEYYEKE